VIVVDYGHVVMLSSAPLLSKDSVVLDGAMLRALHNCDASPPCRTSWQLRRSHSWPAVLCCRNKCMLHWGTVECGCCERKHAMRTTGGLRDVCVSAL